MPLWLSATVVVGAQHKQLSSSLTDKLATTQTEERFDPTKTKFWQPHHQFPAFALFVWVVYLGPKGRLRKEQNDCPIHQRGSSPLGEGISERLQSQSTQQRCCHPHDCLGHRWSCSGGNEQQSMARVVILRLSRGLRKFTDQLC